MRTNYQNNLGHTCAIKIIDLRLGVDYNFKDS